MSNYKFLDKDDVDSVFTDLLETQGQATSLEVKQELRNQGFWATQNEVGVMLRDIAAESGIDWDFNGVYRTYIKPGTTLSNASTPTTVKAPAANPADREPKDTPDVGDWLAYDAQDPTHELYFKGSLTAAQAKYAFTLETGRDYIDVRVNRYHA